MTINTLDDRCPRCGGGFYCGAKDDRCDCFDLNLSEALREKLAKEYEGCLCLGCLKELRDGEARGSVK